MDSAVVAAFIGLIATVVATAGGALGVRRAQNAEADNRRAQAAKALADEAKAAAEARAAADRTERQRMDDRWSALIQSQAAELDRRSNELDRLAEQNERLRQQLSNQRGTP